MEPSLKGQAAVVTGAGGGIGAAVCHKLARLGADVVVVDLDLPAAQRVAQEAEALGARAAVLAGDVCDPALGRQALAGC